MLLKDDAVTGIGDFLSWHKITLQGFSLCYQTEKEYSYYVSVYVWTYE